MSFNGSGTFLINSTGNPVVFNTTISTTWANALTSDLASGLSTAMLKDGTQTPTANIPMHNFKITGLGAPTVSGDALRMDTTLNGFVFAASGVLSAGATVPASTTAPQLIVTNIVELETISAIAATGTIAFYPSTQSILFYTTASTGNFVLNIAWSAGTSMNTALATGQAVTVVFKNTNTGTPHYCTAIQVDGTTSGVTTKWQGGAPGAGNAGAIDIYTITVTKTGSATYNVLASLTPFV